MSKPHCIVCDLIEKNRKAFLKCISSLKKNESKYIYDPLGDSEWVSYGGWIHQEALKITRKCDKINKQKIHILEFTKVSQHSRNDFEDCYDEDDEDYWADDYEDWKFYIEFYLKPDRLMIIEECEELHHHMPECLHKNLDFIVKFIKEYSDDAVIPCGSDYKINFVKNDRGYYDKLINE